MRHVLCALLLRLYPAAFREEYGRELRAAFKRQLSLSVAFDAVATAFREHAGILRDDVRVASRSLRKAPAFTAAVIATLALGIGATTAAFSVVNAVLLRPLPFPEPGQLVEVVETKPLEGITEYDTSIPDFQSWQERATSFSSLAALDEGSRVLTDDRDAERVLQAAVSPTFWPLLGVQPLLGRVFQQAEVDAGDPVAVISEGLLERRYGGDRRVIGRTIAVSSVPHTIVGVVPTDMGFTREVDLWLPWRPAATASRGDRQLNAIARLKPGVTVEQASAELAAIAASLAREFPASNDGYSARARPLLERVVPSSVGRALTLLLVAASLLLLVACANVANLVLTRAVARTPELALRRALGAGATRLARQIVTESLVLAAAGGAAGVMIAMAAIAISRSMLSAALPRSWDLSLDLTTLAVAVVATMLTAFVFALVPVWRASRRDAAPHLRAVTRVSGDRAHAYVRHVFVVAQFSLATVLVTGSVLLTKTMFELVKVDPGFASEQLLLANVSLPTPSYPSRNTRNAFYHRVIDELRSEPGIEAAAFINRAPLTPDGGTGMEVGVAPPVGGILTGDRAHFRLTTSSYFDTVGVPLVEGHVFESVQPEVPNGPRPMVVSQSLARRLWPNGESPIDRRVWLGNGQTATIVGVVGDVHQGRLDEGTTPTMYWPTSRTAVGTMTLIVRTTGHPSDLGAAVRRVIARLDRDLPLFDIRTMDAQIGGTTVTNELNAGVFAAFATLALLLGVTGVGGLILHAVAVRRPELAIRMALGASGSRVAREVAAEGLRLCLAGLLAGVAGAWALGRGMSSMLFGVSGDDPVIISVVAVTLLLVATAACWLPALRATRVDPATVLRGE